MVRSSSAQIVQESADALFDPADASETENESGGKQSNRRNATSLGRRKIDIEFIQDKNKRHITFSKRKAGIMKKAYELATLTGTQVLLLVVSETGLVYTYTTPKLQPLVTARRGKTLIQQCLVRQDDAQDEERPEPKVRQYAPKRATSTPQLRTRMLADANTSSLQAIHDPRAISPFGVPSVDAMAPVTNTNSVTFDSMTSPTGMMPSMDGFPYAPFAPSSSRDPTQHAFSSPPPASPHVHTPGGAQSSPIIQTRTVKRRKTVENLRRHRDVDDRNAALVSETCAAATSALQAAKQNPCVQTLMKAFHAHHEAQQASTNIESTVSHSLSFVQMALSHMYETADSHCSYVQLNSPAENLVDLFDYFFNVYLPSDHSFTAHQIQTFASDLAAFAGWLLANGFIHPQLHIQMIRACTGTSSSTPRRPSPPGSSNTLSDHSQAQRQQHPSGIDLHSRTARAARILGEYSDFSKSRYHNHWDPMLAPIDGLFSILEVAETFCLFDDYALDSEQYPLEAQPPFKIRLALCLPPLLRRGDTIQCTIQKVQGSSFWLPVRSGSIAPTSLSEEEQAQEYDTQLEARHQEMQQCQQADDQVGFALACVAFRKAQRAEDLLNMGEFDDEGFVTSEGLR